MEISLSKFNTKGASAGISYSDNEETPVAEGNTYSAKKACKLAAERLRLAAHRFEMLAKEDKPFNRDTQNRINRLGE